MELGNPTSKVNVIYLLLFSLGASTNGFWRVAPDTANISKEWGRQMLCSQHRLSDITRPSKVNIWKCIPLVPCRNTQLALYNI